MTLDFDPAADFTQAIDGAETVTLLRRGSTPGAPGTVITHALRRALNNREAALRNRYNTRKEVASDGRLVAGDVTWHLPAAELEEAPRLGDLILDALGRRWTILEVQLATLQRRWQCASRDLALAHRLDDTITVLKATYDKGACGAAEATWRPWLTGIRARIQPAGTKTTLQHRARRTAARYQIFVETDIALDHNHRIQGPDGTIYSVIGTIGAERIGELQSIDAETVT